MLDLQNLRELGRGAGRGRGGGGRERKKTYIRLSFPHPSFFFQTNPLPLGCFLLSNLPPLLKSKMAAIAFARPKKRACIVGKQVKHPRFSSGNWFI